MKKYEPIALYIALFVNKYDRFEQQIWLKTPKNHQKQPKSPQITTNTHQPTNMYHKYDF